MLHSVCNAFAKTVDMRHL